MKMELRINKNGTKYYSFVYYDSIFHKPKRISQKDIRKRFGDIITEHDKAQEACKLLDAEVDSLKSRIDKRSRWEAEFYEFGKLLELYESHQRKKAPNSYKNNIHYLKYYVLPFFLSVKKCNNISMWFDYYAEFKDWLDDNARLIKNPEQKISYASKNHAIKALNTFMESLFRKGIVDRYFKCESFPGHKINEKGVDDIIKDEEMEQIYHQLLRDNHPREALFFRFLFFTGMRFNEALGIHPGNIYEGSIENKMLLKHLAQEQITYYGYLVLDSQPAHDTRGLRDTNGLIHRKPLKGKHRIDDKSARTVVIIDKVLWNELVKEHNRILMLYDQKIFGNDIDQYPIFDGIDKTSSSRRLKDAYKKCGLRYRSWHCCRHTRATLLIGQTSNTLLTKLWLGHSSDKVLSRYVHIYEAVIRSAKKRSPDGTKQIKRLDFV